MITIPDTIKNINSDYRVNVIGNDNEVVNLLNSNTKFSIDLELTLNRSNRLLQTAKYIEFYFLSESLGGRDSFNIQFKNFLLENQNSKSKKYAESSLFNEILENDSRKNIFIDYNAAYEENEGLVERINFDLNNFNEDSNIYNANISQAFSKNIFTFGLSSTICFKKIRASILDEDYNIIDISPFFAIDFSASNIRNEVEMQSFEDFYEEKFDIIRNNIDLSYAPGDSQKGELIKIFQDNSFKIPDCEIEPILTYKSRRVVRGDRIDTGQTGDFLIGIFQGQTPAQSSTIQDFTKEIVVDYLSGVNNFQFDVYIELRKFIIQLSGSREQENLTETRVPRSFTNGTINKTINLTRNSSFIQDIVNFKLVEVTNEILSNINIVIGTFIQSTVPNDSKIGIPITFSLSNDFNNEQILSQIMLKDLTIDKVSSSSLDFFYKRQDFSVENKVDYRKSSLFELTSSNNMNVWHQNLDYYLALRSDTKCNINLKLFFNGLEENLTEKTSQVNIEYDNTLRNRISNAIQRVPDETNKLFKQNLICNNDELNLYLTSFRSNPFIEFKKFTLNNASVFSDVAATYGYKNTDGSSDIRNFLKNCKLKISYTSKITKDREHSEDYDFYYNFDNFFDISDLSNVVSIENVVNNFNISEHSLILRSKINQLMYSTTYEDKIIYMSDITNLILSKSLEFEILPIPKLIIDQIGVGLDNNRNIITKNLATEDAVKEFQLVFLIYSFPLTYTNPEGDVKPIKSLFFSDSERTQSLLDTPSLFSRVFELYSNAISRNNIYIKEASYNKNEILNSLKPSSLGTSFNNLNFFLERDVINNSILSNFSIDDSFISYNRFPLTLLYKDYNYNSQNQTYIPEELTIFYSPHIKGSLDMSFFSDEGDESLKNVLISKLLENKVPGLRDVSFNQSLQFLLKVDETSELTREDSELSGNGNKVYLTSYENNEFLTNIDTNIMRQTHDRAIIQRNYNILNILKINSEILNSSNSLFSIAKNANMTELKSVLVRTSISFRMTKGLYSNVGKIHVVFNKEIPRVNLNNNIIKIDNLSRINSRIASETSLPGQVSSLPRSLAANRNGLLNLNAGRSLTLRQ